MKEAGKQACRSLLTGMVLLAGLTFLLVSSSYASVPPTEQSGKIETVEHILHQTQSSIWQQLHSQEVDALVSQLRIAEKAGRDDQAGQLRRQLNQLEKRLLGDAPPADAELARLLQKKKMLLDELARLGGGTQAAASSAVAAAALTAGTSTITGKVTNSSGNAIAEADVLVFDSLGNGESRTTDAAGVYTVENIAAGTYYVQFSADGYKTEWYEDAPQQACATPVTLADGKSETVDAVLETGGRISGKVTDPDGNPVSGAYVYACESGKDCDGWFLSYAGSSTAADGTYTISGLFSRDYKVKFKAPSGSGLLDEWYDNKADSDSADAVAVTAPDIKSGINAQLAKGGSITGTVKDGSNDDALLENVRVYACENDSETIDQCGEMFGTEAGSASTAADGTYTISGLPTGSYKVKFEAPSDSGLLDEWYDNKADSDSADAVAVAAPDTKSGIDATLAKGGSITGTVKDGSNSDAPLSGAYVYAYLCDNASCDSYSSAGYDYTATDGTYTISGLPTGSYKVQFTVAYRSNGIEGRTATGLIDEWYNDKADSNSADVVAVTAPNNKTGIDATVAKGGSISGTVKDGSNSDAPLSGAYVYAYLCDNASCDSYSSAGGYDYTATDGTYTISGLPTGSYKVKFTVAYRSNGIEGGTATGLIDEWYNDKADSNSADVVAVTAPNNKAGIDATVAKGGSITGKVTDSAATPAVVSGARVYAYESIVSSTGTYVHVTPYSSATTDENGEYTISGLPTGSYKVQFNAPYDSGLLDEWYNDKADSDSADAVAVTAPDTKSEINAQLAKGGSITGTVTNDGAAFKCANVSVREVDAYCYEYEGGGEYCYYPTIGSAVTDYQGKYAVKGLLSGSYKVYVSGETSTGDPLGQWYKGRAEGRCANKIGVTAPDETTVDVAFPVQLRQCGGSIIPALKFLLN